MGATDLTRKGSSATAQHRVTTLPYLFACPLTSFFTLRFCEPRAYSRGLSGFSVLRFLRAARWDFLRSPLLSAVVFAMSALSRVRNLVIGKFRN
jgi:hypothetical protein